MPEEIDFNEMLRRLNSGEEFVDVAESMGMTRSKTLNVTPQEDAEDASAETTD